MNSLQTTFLSMIRTALWGDFFVMGKNIKSIDLFKEAYRYGIAGVLSTKLDLFCKDDEKTRVLWTKRALVDIRKSLQVLDAQETLIKLLSKENIKPIFIKGTASSFYYPVPLLREIGDIDFLVLPRDFDGCVKLMEENGYGTSPDEDRHLEYHKDGIEYECHRYFSHNTSEKEKKVDEVLFKGCTRFVTKNVESNLFYTLPDFEYGIMLLEHIRHHLALGVGFRQIIDWAVYADKVLNDKVWESSFKVLVSYCELERLAKTLTRMCQIYLGLNESNNTWCNSVDDSDCEYLLNYIFLCDNFGFRDESFTTMSSILRVKKAGFFKNLNESAQKHFPFINKTVIFKPFAWFLALIRWVYKYTCRRLNAKTYGSKWSKKDWKKNRDFLFKLGVDGSISK